MGSRIFKSVKYVLNCIVDMVFCGMENCILCGFTCGDSLLCSQCKELLKINYLNYPLKDKEETFKCYSLGFYSYSIKKLVLALKYEKNFYAGKVIGEYIGDFIKSGLKEDVDIMTFVPSSSEAMKKRGFNQCEVICKTVSINADIPYKGLLKKIKTTKDQIGLSTEERWENIKDSFTCINTESIKGKNILLIDDVVTTGATAFYCASTLKKFGANEVYILTVAKSRV